MFQLLLAPQGLSSEELSDGNYMPEEQESCSVQIPVRKRAD